MSGIQQFQKSVRKVIKGTIYLGYKDEEKGRPTNSEFFIFDEAPEVEKVLGKQASEFYVRFPSSNPDIIIPSAYEMWKYTQSKTNKDETKARLFCKGNGPDPETGTPGVAVWHDIRNLPPAEEWIGPVNSVTGMVRRQCWGDGCRGEFQPCSSLYDSAGRVQCRPIMRILCTIPQVHPYDLYRISTRSINAIMNFMSWFDHAGRRGEVTNRFYKIYRYAKVAHPYDPVKKTTYETSITTLGIIEDTEGLIKIATPEVLKIHSDMLNNRMRDGDQPLLAASEMQALPPSEFEENPITRPGLESSSPTPEQKAEEYLKDPDIQKAIAAYEEVQGTPMSHKAKSIAIQKRLHLPNVKGAVLEALGKLVAGAQKPPAPLVEATVPQEQVIEAEMVGLEDQISVAEIPPHQQDTLL